MTSRWSALRPGALRLALLLAAVCAIGGVRGWQLARDPAVSFLVDGDSARWITFDKPFSLIANRRVETLTSFRRGFTTSSEVREPDLVIRAMRRFRVYLDGRPVGAGGGLDDGGTSWKQPTRLRLGAPLAPGRHVLTVVVENRYGPPALAAHSEALGLGTDARWEASRAPGRWSAARPAGAPPPELPLRELPGLAPSLAGVAPWLLPPFLAVLAWSGLGAARPRWIPAPPTPSRLRWLLIAAWIALALNNLGKIGNDIGFDVGAHVQYLRWLVQRRSLPLATDGWQMFQAPAYYLVSAPLMALLSRLAEPDTVLRAIRVVPLACGVGQIEILHRVARRVFADRPDLQRIVLVVGGLMPMHLYISQVLGNEPMAGLLTALLILLLVRLLDAPRALAGWRECAAIGVVWGAALLTKASAALMAPALLVAALAHGAATRAALRPWLARAGLVLACALAVGGWFYVRNWIALGQPFVGGWDPIREIEWWQDPGYRTWGQLLSFGAALERPVYAGVHGWWDALHSTLWLDGFLSGGFTPRYYPPWNLEFMLAGSVLALAPAALILCGAWRVAVSDSAEPRWPLRLAAVCLATYLAVMLDLYVRLPIYGTGKATYLLGLLPCFGLLAAAGFEVLARWRATRALGSALLACWALAAFVAYWA